MHYIACSNKKISSLRFSVAFPKINIGTSVVFCLVHPYVVCVDLSGLFHSRQDHLKGGTAG